MKRLFSLLITMTFLSCNKNFYGTYNTNHSKDKSAFFQIKLNPDNSVEKTEIHTIGDFTKGKFLLINKYIVCFFDSSRNKFPPDTTRFMRSGKKLFFVKNGVVNRKNFLVKE
jgi:hypothetical protein